MNLLSFIAPATVAGRRARQEAAEFEATVKPGHTYYSVVDCNWPWGKGRLVQEWKFSKPGRWIGQNPRCGHLTAGGAWLSYGPIHERKPAGLLTIDEYRRRREFPPDAEHALADAMFVPAGV